MIQGIVLKMFLTFSILYSTILLICAILVCAVDLRYKDYGYAIIDTGFILSFIMSSLLIVKVKNNIIMVSIILLCILTLAFCMKNELKNRSY